MFNFRFVCSINISSFYNNSRYYDGEFFACFGIYFFGLNIWRRGINIFSAMEYFKFLPTSLRSSHFLRLGSDFPIFSLTDDFDPDKIAIGNFNFWCSGIFEDLFRATIPLKTLYMLTRLKYCCFLFIIIVSLSSNYFFNFLFLSSWL